MKEFLIAKTNYSSKDNEDVIGIDETIRFYLDKDRRFDISFNSENGIQVHYSAFTMHDEMVIKPSVSNEITVKIIKSKE